MQIRRHILIAPLLSLTALLLSCQSTAFVSPPRTLTAMASSPISARSSASLRFPQDWQGSWQGQCSNTGPAGVQTYAPVTMTLTIQPKTRAANSDWQWRIEYRSPQENQVRDYTLKAVDAAKGHWLIDEHNGILLDNFMVTPQLVMEQFSVGQTLLMGRHELLNDKQIKVELTSFSLQGARNSGAEPYPVSSFKLLSLQSCLLNK